MEFIKWAVAIVIAAFSAVIAVGLVIGTAIIGTIIQIVGFVVVIAGLITVFIKEYLDSRKNK